MGAAAGTERITKTPLRCPLAARLFVFFDCVVVRSDLLEIVGFEDLIAVYAPNIIDPVTPHQEFRALVFTARHIGCRFPYSNEPAKVVKPQMVPARI